jgi:hypothetical protein
MGSIDAKELRDDPPPLLSAKMKQPELQELAEAREKARERERERERERD